MSAVYPKLTFYIEANPTQEQFKNSNVLEI